MGAFARRLDQFEDRLHRREAAIGALVIDRHDDRGLRRDRRGGSLVREDAAGDERDESEDAARRGERDPGKIDDEEDEEDILQEGRAADRHDLVHLEAAIKGERERAAENEEAREHKAEAAAGRGDRDLPRAEALERLHRHCERRGCRNSGQGRGLAGGRACRGRRRKA